MARLDSPLEILLYYTPPLSRSPPLLSWGCSAIIISNVNIVSPAKHGAAQKRK